MSQMTIYHEYLLSTRKTHWNRSRDRRHNHVTLHTRPSSFPVYDVKQKAENVLGGEAICTSKMQSQTNDVLVLPLNTLKPLRST